MRKSSAAFAVTAAAGAVVLTATPALAITIGGGGPITGTAIGNIVATDAGKQITCTSSTVSGTLPNGTNLSNPIGHITSATFSGCSGGGFTFTAVASFPTGGWTINLDSYASGIAVLHISGIHVELKTTPSSNCDVILDGSSSGSGNTGVASGTYDNTNGVFALNPKADTLVAHVVSGCVGLTQTGDAITVTGDYSVKNSSGGHPMITDP